MSKKDKSQVEDGFAMEAEDEVAEADVAPVTEDAEKLAAFKAKKNEAAKRFKERRAEEKKAVIENAAAFIARTKEAGIYDQFTAEEKDFLNKLANPVSGGARSNTSVFTKIFGENPEVGASVTLLEVMDRTLKGKSAIDAYVKKWATENGIIVEFELNSEKITDSRYVLKQL